jgi:hypothetical protein
MADLCGTLKALTHEPEGGKELYMIEVQFSTPQPLHAIQAAHIHLP